MIKIGEVSTFAMPLADKEQATKVLEEAAEVYAEWQAYDRGEQVDPFNLQCECADLIQATCNLLAGIGVNDFTGFIAECKIRNEYRGRMYEETKKPFVREIKEQLTLC